MKTDMIIVFVLVLCAVKFGWDAPRQVMLAGWDETIYMSWGMEFLEEGPPGQDNGPLYALWYFGLHLLQPDPVRLYYLNAVLLTALSVLLAFIAARLLGAGRFTSAAAALFLLLSLGNLRVIPKQAHFAAVGVLALLILLLLLPRRWRLPAGGFGLACLSFARPELIYAALLLSGVAAAVRLRRRKWKRLVSDLLPLLLFLALFGVLGKLPSLSGSSRAIWAFGQHYVIGDPARSARYLDSFMHWETVVQEDFAGAQSIPAAFVANPQAFLGHAARNLRRAPSMFFTHIAAHTPLLLPNTRRVIAIEAAVLLVLLAVALVVRPRATAARFAALFRAQGAVIAVILFVLSVVLITALVIFPREPYLWMATPPGAVLLAAILPSPHVGERAGRVLLLALPAVVPVFINLDYDAGRDQMKELIRLSGDSSIPAGTVVGDPCGAEVYLRGSRLRYIGVWNAGEFDRVLREQRPLLIWRLDVLESLIQRKGIALENYELVSSPRFGRMLWRGVVPLRRE